MQLEALTAAQPDLIVDLLLYSSDVGGRKRPVQLGWGCPCSTQTILAEGWDGWPLLGDIEMHPGERRRLGFVFTAGRQAADIMRAAGKFYLWDGQFIGEAIVVD